MDIENNFAEFMQEALYGEEGFYTKGGGAGRVRDYLTSPEVGDLFGYVLADYIDTWYESLNSDSNAIVIDVGCGPGSLVASIARAQLRNSDYIEFYLVDKSPVHRATAKEKLQKVSPMFSYTISEELPECNKPTLIIANELLDNLVFNIGRANDIYQPFNPDAIEKPIYSAYFGITGDIDLAKGANVSRGIGDFKIPLHVGMAKWFEDLSEATAQVTSLTVLFFDYMKSVNDFQDANWLRLYENNKRIVGVDKVLSALAAGARGDITTDVTIEDLHLVLDLHGFSKINLKSQTNWLLEQGIEDFCVPMTPTSAYDQLESLIKVDKQIDPTIGFQKERDILLDENGLGSFKVISAKREI